MQKKKVAQNPKGEKEEKWNEWKVFLKGLTLEELRKAKKLAEKSLSEAERKQEKKKGKEARKKLDRLVFDNLIKLFKEEDYQNKDLEDLIEDAYNKIPCKDRWVESFADNINCHEIPCDEDDCWSKGNLDRFDGSVVFYQLVYGDHRMCEVDWENFSDVRDCYSEVSDYIPHHKFRRWMKKEAPEYSKWYKKELYRMDLMVEGL